MAKVEPWQLGWHQDGGQPSPWLPFPATVSNHAVWLHHCFSLNLRDVEATLAVATLSRPTSASLRGDCALNGYSPPR